MRRCNFFYYSLIILTIAISSVASASKLPDSVTSLLAKYKIKQDEIGIDVRRVDNKQSLLQHNADKLFNPASAIKVLTTMAGLEILGPNFTWQTQYYYTGELDRNTLKGDLILYGGGDPFLTEDRLWTHMREIYNLGIENIQGDLIIDNTRFDLPPHDRSAFDGQGNRLYNVGPDAALVNFSATQIRIKPLEDQPVVFAQPYMDNFIIENKLALEEGKCTGKENGWTLKTERKDNYVIARIEGKYRKSCGEHAIGRAFYSNHEYTHQIIKGLWHSLGGKGIERLKIGPGPKDAKFLIAHISLPLSDIITSINKWSNNVMTQQLLLTIGGETNSYPSTFAEGITAIRQWLDDNSIDMPGLVIENGSGLSRIGRVSSKGLGNLLHYAWNHDYQAEFLSSLPITAVDGTMRKRLKKHELHGRARIKTGYLNSTRSMAGFVRAKNGDNYSVVMLINSDKVSFSNGNQIQDALLKWIYESNS